MLEIVLDSKGVDLKEYFDKNSPQIKYEMKTIANADVFIPKDVGVKRSQGFDFIISLINDSIIDECEKLQKAYTNPVLILEGLNDFVFKNMKVNVSTIYETLSFITYKMGISLIPTNDIKNTAIVIERIAYREQVKDDAPILARRAPKGMTEKERQKFIVEGLIGIGSKKAEILIKKFKTPFKVCKAIKETEILYTCNGTPKGIKGPLEELKGFGIEFIKKNKEMLFGKKELKKQVKIDAQFG